MIRIILLSCLTWALTLTAGWADSWAFVNVTVIPMDQDGVLAGQTVLVQDGMIEDLGPVGSIPLPPGVRRIDGEGRYLMPGLAEMHAHVPQPGQGRGFQERVLALYVLNGVTTVRGMLGHPDHLRLKQRIESGDDVLAPRLFTSGPSLNGNSVDGARDARQKVRAQKKSGYDFLKLHPGLSREEYDAIVETAQEVDIPYAGHVSVDVGLARTLEAQQATVDHFDGYMQAMITLPEGESAPPANFFGVLMGPLVDSEKLRRVAQQTADAGVWNVPTQTLFENVVAETDPDALRRWPEMRYVDARTLDQWTESKQSMQRDERYSSALAAASIGARRQLILELHKAGAGLLLGSDAPQIFNVPGFSVHRELGLFVDSGLTPFEAIATGTTNPARFFGAEDSFGTVAKGKAADLILLRENPLQDIRNTQTIEGVMLRGRWLSRSDIDGWLESLETS